MAEFDVEGLRAQLQQEASSGAASTDAPAVVRLPEDALEGLGGFDHPARYREVDGIRLAHVDAGEGRPVVFVHGVPAWSYLWREPMRLALEAGYRCIAPDMAGFGRSDKPTQLGWYTFDRHCGHLSALVEELDLRGATMVIHDWGGAVGLRVAAEHPERFDRLVILDTDLHTGETPPSETWHAFRDFVTQNEDIPIGSLVRAGCHADPGDEVIAAYERPYPIPAAKAGARAFPLMHPTSPDHPDARTMRGVRDALRARGLPALILWADADPVLPVPAGERLAAELGREPPRVLADTSHFLQEDKGSEVGALIADWLQSTEENA